MSICSDAICKNSTSKSKWLQASTGTGSDNYTSVYIIQALLNVHVGWQGCKLRLALLIWKCVKYFEFQIRMLNLIIFFKRARILQVLSFTALKRDAHERKQVLSRLSTAELVLGCWGEIITCKTLWIAAWMLLFFRPFNWEWRWKLCR